jgi:hypothetical protein
LTDIGDQVVRREVLADLEEPIEDQPALTGGTQPSAPHHRFEFGSQALSLSQLY